ncbi:MAG TPA: hypothetical protein VIG30_12565 [Ktedonobacterales bacterium]
MKPTDLEHSWRVKHSRLLYQYYRARQRDDQTVLAALYLWAESDLELVQAMQQIDQALVAKPNPAFDLAAAVRRERMPPAQYLRALYICATLAKEAQQNQRALEYVDEAIELAVRPDPSEILVGLLYLRAQIHRMLSAIRPAIEDYRTCLALYRDRPEYDQNQPTRVEVQILVELAGMEFFLALYPAAEQHAQEASARLGTVADAAHFAARLEWLRALLFRWRGQPEMAMRPAAQAINLLEPGHNASDLARLHVVAAGITLDLAERLPEGTDRLSFTRLGERHTKIAVELAYGPEVAPQQSAQDLVDREALAMAQIESLRCSRLSGSADDHSGPLRNILERTQSWHDSALEAQARTALGQEWGARGETERALNQYRVVLSITDRQDMPALGVWARRALLRLSENSESEAWAE